jgi:hypothetical protein
MAKITFTLDELGLASTILGMALENALDRDEPAPKKVTELLQSIMDKLCPAIDEECAIFNQFQELANELDDVYLASKLIAKNVDAVTTDYE